MQYLAQGTLKVCVIRLFPSFLYTIKLPKFKLWGLDENNSYYLIINLRICVYNLKDPLKALNIICIFLIIYLVPMVINFIQTGPILIGNIYQTKISYITELNDLINHLTEHCYSYLNIFTNPIFWFFLSAYVTQKTIKWVITD